MNNESLSRYLVKNGYAFDYKRYSKEKFNLVQTNREYSCDIRKIDFTKYKNLINNLESKGIKFLDSKNEMLDLPNHYQKLEELCWVYGQDIPIPKGIKREREPFDKFLKNQANYEKNYYAVEIIAVKTE